MTGPSQPGGERPRRAHPGNRAPAVLFLVTCACRCRWWPRGPGHHLLVVIGSLWARPGGVRPRACVR
ncbi:hypothetical protein ACFPM0_28340 [Pseudonocardia sulfidoxydans]|uniref:hypothetical protein n=1 Tax=Pseudonocardia sulfidoxydans TaxID=54011 RepID=UPI00360B09D7